MIIRKSQLLIRTIIVRKQGPREIRPKKLQDLNSRKQMQDEII